MNDDGIGPRLRQAAGALRAEQVSLQELLQAHGPAGQGALLLMLATLCLLPVPGVGAVLGMGLVAVAVSMWRGQAMLVLPERLGNARLPLRWARRALSVMARVYELARRWMRPRWLGLADACPGVWAAGTVGLMALLIVLPIPLGNLLPAVALLLLGLGLGFRDGLVLVLAMAVAGLALLFPLALGLALWDWGGTWA